MEPAAIMRHYIRHPADIPIEICHAAACEPETLRDIGYGGLAFHSHEPIAVGLRVQLKIPLARMDFEALGKVAWCRKSGEGFDIGIEFLAQDDAYKARMVEQICHIEQYRQEVMAREGRSLSAQEAAIEWVRKFAHRFPAVEE